MKHTAAALTLAAIATISMTGCSGRASKDTRESRHDAWTESLSDSVAALQAEIDSCGNNIDLLHHQVGVWLRDFTRVAKSREVEPYTIFHGWEAKYPPQTTSLVARIADNEALELVAVNSGRAFSSITVVTPEGSATSETVPQDQALNYRRGNLSTVMFTGAKADSIAELIANNELNNIKVIYQNPGAVATYALPEANKKMITATWELYHAQKEAGHLERRQHLLSEKIKILRATIDKNSKDSAD